MGNCESDILQNKYFDPRKNQGNSHTLQRLNSLPAIDAHERQRFNELCGTVVSRQIFIHSQSLIAR